MHEVSISSIDKKPLVCFVEVRFFGKVYKKRFDGDLKRLHKWMGICISLLLLICFMSLGFAIRQAFVANGIQTEVATLQMRVEDLQTTIFNLQQKWTDLRAENVYLQELEADFTKLKGKQNI